ncbi:hypothetical protein G7K_4112-t1 [Saitoella complicata NRRL Y-17804]|uniref:ATP-dependent DNA helicase PIF1 n=1 Tax=Saitoella complicata (strain BCRC 22490 / CBS 7301 / JCM 7358 / NBRC 10748 / NRRL Y-17804) TaxID=698492 RepID=A0A0E9NJD1_SAICN|nr:hypothetical protein G7K_4112-t1 [Saitoella complicata NRRL Y-17804]
MLVRLIHYTRTRGTSSSVCAPSSTSGLRRMFHRAASAAQASASQSSQQRNGGQRTLPFGSGSGSQQAKSDLDAMKAAPLAPSQNSGGGVKKGLFAGGGMCNTNAFRDEVENYAQYGVEFNEADFDDDLDLDFSVPTPKVRRIANPPPPQQQPRLPFMNAGQQPPSAPPAPPAPRQQQQREAPPPPYSKYELPRPPAPLPSMNQPIPPSPLHPSPARGAGVPSSSAPFEWSSSPQHHQTATVLQRRPPSQGQRRVGLSRGGPAPGFKPPSMVPKPVEVELKREGSLVTPVKKEKAPRTLPWETKNRDAGGVQQSIQQRTLSHQARSRADPQVKDERTALNSSPAVQPEARTVAAGAEKRAYPWEKSMSAIQAEKTTLKKKRAAEAMVKNEEAAAAVKDEGAENKAKVGRETVTMKDKSRNVPGIFLSQEQRGVIDLVLNQKKSVFFTGSAGTGKSVLLRELISELKRSYKKSSDSIAVTASTGLAACNIGGTTLHSFAGIGLGKESVADLVKKIKKNKKAATRWMRTKVLIVDEISMVDADLFDKLEELARTLRNNTRPFGGIQLVMCGDFFQLPPVPDANKQAKFTFEAKSWKEAIGHTIALTQVFRQKDQDFVDMLNEMRMGKLTQKTVVAFQALSRARNWGDGLEPTELFPTRWEVDNANTTRLRQLSGEARTFNAMDTGSVTDKAMRDKLLASCMAPPVLELKMGAQVMLIKNVDEQLVNGSLGKVIGYMNEKTFQTWQDECPDDDPFGLGEESDGENPSKKRKRAKVQMLQSMATTGKLWPLVRFEVANGASRDFLCQPESWKVELPNGDVQAQRSQVPLLLAWAMSIHKSQGQTLERVKVDLGRVFEKGQAYVALSRATSQAGLQVLRFQASKVMAHPKVSAFYRSLMNITGPSKVIAATLKDDKRQQRMELDLMQMADMVGPRAAKRLIDDEYNDDEEAMREFDD